jgi:hypothetical protein
MFDSDSFEDLTSGAIGGIGSGRRISPQFFLVLLVVNQSNMLNMCHA